MSRKLRIIFCYIDAHIIRTGLLPIEVHAPMHAILIHANPFPCTELSFILVATNSLHSPLVDDGYNDTTAYKNESFHITQIQNKIQLFRHKVIRLLTTVNIRGNICHIHKYDVLPVKNME